MKSYSPRFDFPVSLSPRLPRDSPKTSPRLPRDFPATPVVPFSPLDSVRADRGEEVENGEGVRRSGGGGLEVEEQGVDCDGGSGEVVEVEEQEAADSRPKVGPPPPFPLPPPPPPPPLPEAALPLLPS